VRAYVYADKHFSVIITFFFLLSLSLFFTGEGGKGGRGEEGRMLPMCIIVTDVTITGRPPMFLLIRINEFRDVNRLHRFNDAYRAAISRVDDYFESILSR
jgi:hypothetical protein